MTRRNIDLHPTIAHGYGCTFVCILIKGRQNPKMNLRMFCALSLKQYISTLETALTRLYSQKYDYYTENHGLGIYDRKSICAKISSDNLHTNTKRTAKFNRLLKKCGSMMINSIRVDWSYRLSYCNVGVQPDFRLGSTYSLRNSNSLWY